MAKVHVYGHRAALDRTLSVLHSLGMLHLIDISEDHSLLLPPLHLDEDRIHQIEDLRYLQARVNGILSLIPHAPRPFPDPAVMTDADTVHLRRELDEEGPEIERLVRRLDQLVAEEEALPRHVAALRRLLPLVPDLTELAGYETTAMLIEARHQDVLGQMNAELEGLLGGNFEIISDQVDADTVGAVLVFPRKHAGRVHVLLGREQLTRVRLPREFERLPFRPAIVAMERRLVELPLEISATRDAIDDFVRPRSNWAAASIYLAARLDQLSAIRHLGATPHTFALAGWMPEGEVRRVADALRSGVGADVLLERSEPAPDDAPPVLMENPAPARPFEFLVRLLALPRYGSLDPTQLMTLFLPLFFGMMLGDIAYGALLLVIAVSVGHRFRTRPGGILDLSRILTLSSGWTIVWGVVYGEFLGDLGHRWFGLEPIWINREEALEPLLLFAIGIGAAHVTLGLMLGIWETARTRQRRLLTERAAMLVAMAGVFLIAAVATDQLPGAMISPAVALLVVGLVVLMVQGGAMGILLGPLELLGTLGNVLSYLRIAAIGLASVYLARVANELGGTAPLWLGIVIAALFHALNLALGAFSPTIQSLRLHYVEFFGKFFDAGGEPFRPFGQNGPTQPRFEAERR